MKEFEKQKGVTDTNFAILIHSEGSPKDSMWMALPLQRQSMSISTLQAIADDIAKDRCSAGSNFTIKAVRNPDNSFTMKFFEKYKIY